MEIASKYNAYMTIVRIEFIRIFSIWQQRLVPPAITSILYFVIFGHVIGDHIGTLHHYHYSTFIAPGLIMMQMITSAYTGCAFTFYFAKFSRSIETILVSPMSNFLMLVSFMTAGMLRGIVVGVIVTIIAAIFADLPCYSIISIFVVTLLSTAIFSLLGLINGVLAQSFDDIATIPNFVITPLTYFGGVFYAVSMLPNGFRQLSLVNPIYYIVEAFRYGFLGYNKPMLTTSISILVIMFIVVFAITWIIFKRGAGLRP